MTFCHKCGKRVNLSDDFCAHCGTQLQEESSYNRGLERQSTSKGRGSVLIIILAVLVIYFILDFWAMTQLTPVLSFDSIVASASNFQGDASLSKISAATTIRVENPTFVPILFTRLSYDANYGSTKIAEGKTGFFIIGPYSQQDIPLDLTISNFNAIKSGLQGVWNALTGQHERAYVNIYLDLGITKFIIRTIG